MLYHYHKKGNSCILPQNLEAFENPHDRVQRLFRKSVLSVMFLVRICYFLHLIRCKINR